MTKTINEPDLKQAEKLILQMKELSSKGPILAIAGGEPLLYPHLQNVLHLFRENFPKNQVEVLTNATLINKNNVSWLKELTNGANISLDGATANVHDKVRGKGAFLKTLKGIDLLLSNNIAVCLRMTYLGQREDEALKIMGLCKELGVPSFNFRYAVPVGRAKENDVLLDSALHKKLCQKIWEKGKELGLTIGFSDPFPGLFFDPEWQAEVKKEKGLGDGTCVTGCSVAFNLLYLDPESKVRLCPYLPLYCGDAKKESLKNIWNNSELMQTSRFMRHNLEGKCGKCEHKFSCGGCRGAAWAMGNVLGEEPRCWK